MKLDDKKAGTKSVWAGESDGFADGSSTTPVYSTVTFAYEDLDTWKDVALGQQLGHIYSRNTNPTVQVLEEKIRVLEGAEAAVSFSTGMAGISNLLFALLKPGDRVVSIRDSYGGTSRIFLEHLPRFGIDAVLVDTTDVEAIEREVAKGCALLYLESPTNPTLKVMDLERLSAAARKVGAITVCDNTFATPINQNPIQHGVDLVVHSATKYLGGHSDVMCGLVCGRKDLVQRIFAFREITGASLHPDSAYMVIRGMKTLELRVERQNASALRIARWLKQQPKVERVFHPGLEDDPGHAVAARQMRGFGGMLAFELKSGADGVARMLHAMELRHLAASLGSVSTLVGPPSVTSHVELTAAQRKELGISESLVRYSVGIENVEDLLDDLERGLRAV
ncbi:MAG: cystathionine gamma-synthase family protein [Rhodothermales bacterium]